jgi:hypothetical protein
MYAVDHELLPLSRQQRELDCTADVDTMHSGDLGILAHYTAGREAGYGACPAFENDQTSTSKMGGETRYSSNTEKARVFSFFGD